MKACVRLGLNMQSRLVGHHKMNSPSSNLTQYCLLRKDYRRGNVSGHNFLQVLLNALETIRDVGIAPIFLYHLLEMLANIPGLMKTGDNDHQTLEGLLVDLCDSTVVLAMCYFDFIKARKFFLRYLWTCLECVTKRIFHPKSG
jgi:hypothetical protein